MAKSSGKGLISGRLGMETQPGRQLFHHVRSISPLSRGIVNSLNILIGFPSSVALVNLKVSSSEDLNPAMWISPSLSLIPVKMGQKLNSKIFGN